MIASGDLQAAAARLADAMAREADALNEADGALGDGDLGITMSRGSAAAAAEALPADLGQAFLRMAGAFTKVSGSSYGTLFATGLMAAAKALKGREGFEASEVSGLLAAARDAMAARGKSQVGSKTVLDSLDAMARATEGVSDPAEVARAAVAAAREAVEAMRHLPASVGRARIWADKSVGMADPGMLAMAKVAEAVVAP